MLSLLIFWPLLTVVLILFLKKVDHVRWVSLGSSIVLFAGSISLLFQFDKAQVGFQFYQKLKLFSSLGVNYEIGLDGVSLWLVLLTTFLNLIVVLATWTSYKSEIKTFMLSLFLLQTSMLGSFLALDLILFYLFFEASLIPMALMIGVWGGERKNYAALKFFLFTMLGSIFMLMAIMVLSQIHLNTMGVASTSLLDLKNISYPFVKGDFFSTQSLLFVAFTLAFAIKVPLFPFHTWLPDAHVQAPTPGSVILAGVMLKMGTYGLYRFSLGLFPEASFHYAWVLLILSVIGIIYGALVAMVQTDIKKLVAYSSVSHMGYVVLGLFSLNSFGIQGSIYQMLNHGLSTGALFLLVGMLYERTHDRKISSYGGLATHMPLFTIVFLIITFSSIAVPLTNGFVGEFLILLGAFQANAGLGALALVGVVLGATYMLWLVKRVFFGPSSELSKSLENNDLTRRELAILAPIIILVFVMGIYPSFILDYFGPSTELVAEFLKQSYQSVVSQ